MHGPTAEEVTALIAHGAHEEIEKRVLAAYRELERQLRLRGLRRHRLRGLHPGARLRPERQPRQPARLPGAGGAQRSGERRRRRGGAARARRAPAQGLRALRSDRQPRRARRRGRGRAPARAEHRPGVGLRDARARRARLPERGRDPGRPRRPPGAGRRWHARARRARRAGGGDERRALHRGPRGRHPRGGAGRPLGHRRRVPRLDALPLLPHRLRAAADRAATSSPPRCGGCWRPPPSRCSRSTRARTSPRPRSRA